jgi:hypothetical protein
VCLAVYEADNKADEHGKRLRFFNIQFVLFMMAVSFYQGPL